MSILDKIEERHAANSLEVVSGEKVYYDVIFNDRVGNTAVHIETGGRGGSEEATIRLAELLAAEGFQILILTRDNFREPDVSHWKGVVYRRADGQFNALRCHALVNLRHSPEPVGLEYEHYFEWVHDVPEGWCRHNHLPREDMHLVAVSQWQLERFQPGAVGPDGAVQPSVPWKSTSVIHPILPSYASYKHEPVKHRFLYASSVVKGLLPTLELWRSLSLPSDAELFITNPGYDLDKVPKDLRPNEKLLGVLPDMHAVAELMRTCEGLFYVNAWPENFSQTVAMADAIGLKTHVLCTSEWADEGGLGETAPGNLITRYRDIFLSDFIRLLGKSITGHVRAKLGTVAEWVELLRLRESVLLNTIDTLDQANRPTAVAASAQEHLDATYTKDFYQDNLNRRHEFRRFAGAIALVFPGEHASVLDIGCGAGLVVAELRARGYDARGFDGSRHAVESADSELHGIVVQRSITDSSAPPLAPSDYTVCSEVAEHLPEKYAQDLIHLVARATKRRCVWSAAPPGQHGLDHVNLQLPDYWLKPFAERGLHVNESATQTLRGAMRESQSVHSAYAENFYVLERRDFANVGTIESISEPILGRPTSPDIFTRNDVPNWVNGTITVEHDRFRRRKNVVKQVYGASTVLQAFRRIGQRSNEAILRKKPFHM
jgi:SAM-dependent methyltransferase